MRIKITLIVDGSIQISIIVISDMDDTAEMERKTGM